MRCRDTQTWTFLALVGAFLDLTITFLVLCCSLVTFLTSKLLSLFYLDLPCPCRSGLFGAAGDKCPLVSCPVTKIRSVQTAAKNCPPFDSMWVAEREESCCSHLDFSSSPCLLGRQNSTPTPSVTRRFSVSSNKRLDVDDGCDDAEMVRVLERALEEEHAKRAALHGEWEKERNAAASAAEEAMAMIDKIQKEKATVEMNARQYQRMMEEKNIYDEDEMEKLKEIVIRRERELLELGNKLEIYRKMAANGAIGMEETWVEEQEDEEDETSEMLQEIYESVRKKEKVRLSNKIWRVGSSRVDKTQKSPAACDDNDDDEQMDYQEKGVVSVDSYRSKDRKILLHPPPPPPPPRRRLDRSLEHEFQLEVSSHPETESAAEFDVHVISDTNEEEEEEEEDNDNDDIERSKLDAEIEGLTRKLKNVLRDQNQRKRRKKMEKDDLQLKLLQEISLQIRHIHQQSAFPQSPKVDLKKRLLTNNNIKYFLNNNKK